MLKLIFALIAVAVAVPAGGLLAGVDRRLTARLQSRQGPPLLQPFYDVLKLLGKAPCVTNPWLICSLGRGGYFWSSKASGSAHCMAIRSRYT